MVSRKEARGRRSRGDGVQTFWISAGSSLVVQFVLTAGYAVLTILSLQAPPNAFTSLMARSDRLLQPAMAPILAYIGRPPCGGGSANLFASRLYEADAQVVAVDLAVAACCFLLCIPFWRAWAKQLQKFPLWATAQPEQRESRLEIGQGLTLLGAAGAAWFLFADAYPISTARCSMFSAWLLLRAPLITTIVYGLSCFTAAFAVARAPGDG
jgi:hypothetical protein